MADVFATVLTPDIYKAAAIELADGAMNFSPGFSATGIAPATHWMNSGMIPQNIRDIFAGDDRFSVTALPWREVATLNNLQRVL